MADYPINLGKVILPEIELRMRQNETTLPFPCLLTEIMTTQEVPEIPHLDILTEATSKLEVDLIKDEGNPALQKKKQKVGESSRAVTVLPTDAEADIAPASEQGDPSEVAGSSTPGRPTTRVPFSLMGQASVLQVPGIVTATATVVNTMNEKLNNILREPLLTAKEFKETMQPINENLKNLVSAQKEQTSEMKKMRKQIKSLEDKVDKEIPALKKEVASISKAFHQYSRGDLSFLEETAEDDEEEDPAEAEAARLRGLALMEDMEDTDRHDPDAEDTLLAESSQTPSAARPASQTLETPPQPATAELTPAHAETSATPAQPEPPATVPTTEAQP